MAALLVGGAARAADIHIYHRAEDHVAFIFVQGELTLADGNAFAAATKTIQAFGPGHVAVIFDSPGGSLGAGLRIGLLIRLYHYATFSPQDDAACASACALAWLAGTPRMMEPDSHIGFHAAFIEHGAEKTEDGKGNALVGAYMTKMGLSFAAIAWAESAHPDDISWLTPQDARRLGIDVSVLPPFKQAARPRPATTAPEHAAPDELPSLLIPDQPALPATAEDRARHFADDYFAHWSEQNRDAIGYFGTTYAQTVTYYGKSIDHDTLLQSKRGYAERWPVRVYNPRPASIHSFCNPAGTVCTVSGIVDWDCRNPAGNAASTGSANFSLTVSLASGREQVLAESGSVISRGGN